MPVLEEVTFGLFAEVQRATTAIVSAVRHVWSGYVNLRHVRTENETLRRQLAAAEIQVQEQRALASRSRGLSAALALRDRSHLRMTAAEVIAFGAAPDFRTLTIDKGMRQGLQNDMAVIAPAGVVGRVVVPSARAAKIQLLIDRNAAVGVLIERSRAQGVVIGTGDELLRMEYVSEGGRRVGGRRRRHLRDRRNLPEGVRCWEGGKSRGRRWKISASVGPAGH